MRRFFFLIAFGAAIWAIGDGWAALLGAWASPTWGGAAAVLGYLAVFLAAFLYLGFGIYTAERAAGKVRTRIGVYERFLARRAGPADRDQGTGSRELTTPRNG